MNNLRPKLESKKSRKVLLSSLEEDVFSWFKLMEEILTTIVDNIFCDVTRRFYSQLCWKPRSMEHFFLKGWIDSF